MQLPAQKRQLLPYALALGPPFVLQLFFSQLFFSALDIAGTYGVLVLFGVLPAAMTWQVRLLFGCSLRPRMLRKCVTLSATVAPAAAAVASLLGALLPHS